MTEQEWLVAIDPTPMLECLKGKASDRKLRLLAVSFAQRAVHLCEGKRAIDALGVAELIADGEASGGKRVTAYRWVAKTFSHPVSAALAASSHSAAIDSGREAVRYLAIHTAPLDAEPGAEQLRDHEREREREHVTQCGILRDIFGNPFRPVAVDPAWLTSDVVAIANGIYDEKAFDRLPILADALQDAGCEHADILNHCRHSVSHVRGCWVVDLLLGKE